MDVETEIIPGYESIEQFFQACLVEVTEATRKCNALPAAGGDWNYYSSFRNFSTITKLEQQRIFIMLQNLLRHQAGRKFSPDVDDMFDALVYSNDIMLERADTALDEAECKNKTAPELVIVEMPSPSAAKGRWNSRNPNSPNVVRLLAAKNVERPQIKFKDPVDNSHEHFVPKLKEKPNSLKPLAILPVIVDGEIAFYPHPYEYELELFEAPERQLGTREPLSPRPVAETSLVMVDTEESLHKMIKVLDKQIEIAVDLEHHSYRTFLGITCLIQISTRTTDYIVDAIELRSSLECLNSVFTNKSILKVFHGAEKDIEWLQRDFGVYVVNMFDTYHAAKKLSLAHLSLAYLLKHYCRVDANKEFQLADWRMRPLPEQMIRYAREDTHYLLYIYDRMRNELLVKNPKLLPQVYNDSKAVCLTRYEKPVCNETSYLHLYKKSQKSFDHRQEYALRELYIWRDKVARENDESTGFVLPNHMLLQIADVLPREMQGILACCTPTPTLVKQNLLDIHRIVYKAREQKIENIGQYLMGKTPHQTVVHKGNFYQLLYCPYDSSQDGEFRNDLPTLLGKTLSLHTNVTTLIKKEPSIPLLSSKMCMVMTEAHKEKISKVKFLSPYARYQLVKSMFQAIEQPQLAAEKDLDERVKKFVSHYRKVSDAKMTVPPEETASSSLKRSHEDIKEEKEENELIPLRDMLPKKQKMHKKPEETSIPTPPPPPNKQNPRNNMKPFDYQSVDYREFQGGSNRRNFRQRNRGRGRGKQIGSRTSRGGRSMTYSK